MTFVGKPLFTLFLQQNSTYARQYQVRCIINKNEYTVYIMSNYFDSVICVLNYLLFWKLWFIVVLCCSYFLDEKFKHL